MESTQGMYRSTDPATSREAAESIVDKRSALKKAIRNALRETGPTTDEVILARPEFAGYRESTVRTRRSELVAEGAIIAVGERLNSRGRKMIVWGLSLIEQ